jgi:hypothetical protein
VQGLPNIANSKVGRAGDNQIPQRVRVKDPIAPAHHSSVVGFGEECEKIVPVRILVDRSAQPLLRLAQEQDDLLDDLVFCHDPLSPISSIY